MRTTTAITICLALGQLLLTPAAHAAPQSHPEQDPGIQDADRIAPARGAAVAKPMKPDWCGDYTIKPRNDWTSALYDDNRHYITLEMKNAMVAVVRDPVEELNPKSLASVRWILVQAACAQPDEPLRQAWVAIWRQSVLNRLPVTEKEDRAMMATMVRELQGHGEARCKKLRALLDDGSRDPELDAIWAAQLGIWGSVFSCEWGGTSLSSTGWLLDRRTQPESELMRVAFLTDCLSERFSDHMAEYVYGAYALCGWDARNLDRVALEKELARLGVDGDSANIARDRFAWVLGRGLGYTRRLQALAKKKPAFQKILFDAPDAAIAEWDRLQARHEAVLNMVYRLEDTLSERGYKAIAGNAAALRAAFGGYVARHKSGLETFEDVLEWVSGPVANTVLEMQTILDAADGNPAAAHFFKRYLFHASPLRGPRALAFNRAATALARARADDERFPRGVERLIVKLPASPLVPKHEHLAKWESLGPGNGLVGMVKAVRKVRGGYVTVVFRDEVVTVPDVHCKPSNRLSHIDRDGRFVYQQDCRKVGTMKVNNKLPDVRIRAALARGIKPGMALRVSIAATGSEYEGNRILDAFPITGCRGKACSRINLFLGYPL